MWFKAQFIVYTSGIFNENAAGLCLFLLHQWDNISILPSSAQVGKII
jgi:hypothetical protein